MQYNYEALTPDRFQELCQALVTHSFPEALSFPVGKRDGGRDALVPLGKTADIMVVQVKFRRTREDGDDAAKLALAAFKSELPNIRRLHQRGATRYVLMTNLSATAGLDTGQRDRVQASLDAISPIPATVWWREEVDARLNDAYDIKWAFSDVITSADLLRKMIEQGFDESPVRRDLAVTAYLTSQYTYDEVVKFKQADLQASDLLTLFIDVPASPQRNPDAKRERETRILMQGALAELPTPVAQQAFRSRRDQDVAVGAASLLLSPRGQEGLDSVVLEGGPGQGKSTLAQYVCQVHRMRLLGKSEKLDRVPVEHRLAPVRVPFKVDLRDFASWLRRMDPFNGGVPMPLGTTPSLESFLAAQVTFLSGGQDFTVDDLRLFLRRVPAVLVLDGLDEVAVVSDRREVIEATNAARSRLAATAASVQLIVTSRPAATVSTPRFSGGDWHFLDLQSITEELIFDYTERWAAARRLAKLDVEELKETLASKLASPHIKDLSRNAMQLTILLQLIHSRGAALPDQRTQLYDRYVDVLFNREADKNRVVRTHRQLLIDIHGYVAWRMHASAQSKRSNGRVSEDELLGMISSYMTSRGHDVSVIDDLFSGVVQRVVALVSRVQGTFEFEVQPLREYFAGRHLYNTAPSSPVGNPQKGTKLDIFDALSRQPYWLNVTRFYAGCYSVGELAGLADQVETLVDNSALGLTSFSRVVATSLLGDRVFQQSPKVTAGVVAATANPLSLRFAFARAIHRAEGPVIGVPIDCGQNEFLRLASERAVSHRVPSIRLESAMVAQESFSHDAVLDQWLALEPAPDASADTIEKWLIGGGYLGTTAGLPAESALRLATRSEVFARRLAQGGSLAVLSDPTIQRQVFMELLDGRGGPVLGAGEFGIAMLVLDARRMGWQFDSRYGQRLSSWRGALQVADPGIRALVTDLSELVGSGDLGPEGRKVTARKIESAVGRCWAAWALGIQAHMEGVQAEDLETGQDETLSADDVVAAVATARRRQASPEWWFESLSTPADQLTKRALMAMCCLWATPSVLERNLPLLARSCAELSEVEFETLLGFLESMRRSSPERGRLSGRVFESLASSKPNLRCLVALTTRSTEESRKRVLADAATEDLIADGVLAEMAIDSLLDHIPDSNRVEELIERIAELFPHANESLIFGYRFRAPALAEGVARTVLLDPDRYPSALVQSADASLSAEITRGPGVATIARRQRWAAG